MELLEAIDLGMWNYFQALRRPWLDPIVLALAFLGSTPAIMVSVLLAGFHFLIQRESRSAVFVTLAVLGSFLLILAAQPLVGRERYVGINLLELPRTPWSFPDEPALLATATYLALGFLAADRHPEWRASILLGTCAAIAAIGIARMFLGICFPTDVLGGWLGGGAWVLTCRWLIEDGFSPTRAAETIGGRWGL